MEIGLARLEEKAQIESAKAHAVGYVGQQAMQTVTMVSQMEAQSGQACPPWPPPACRASPT